MQPPTMDKGERVAKVIARSGFCSRRDAEKLIAEGRVAINRETLTTPAVTVTAGDSVTIDGEPIPAASVVKLWRYHKPPGLLTTHADPRGRPTVFERLPEDIGRVISVGRLDFTSEGLLLVTNSGALARRLELPSTGWKRRYRVRCFGAVSARFIAALAKGVTVEGVHYSPIVARIDRTQGANTWLTLSLTEGKNREIRKVLAAFDIEVNRLIRIGYGPFQLGNLARGAVAEVPSKTLREQLGTVAGL